MFYLILCNDKTNSRCMYILCTSGNKFNLNLNLKKENWKKKIYTVLK